MSLDPISLSESGLCSDARAWALIEAHAEGLHETDDMRELWGPICPQCEADDNDVVGALKESATVRWDRW